MSRLNRSILTMFCAGIFAFQSNATNRLEPVYLLNVLQYVPHVTSADNAREDTCNFAQVSKKSREAMIMSHINTFPIRSEKDAEMFPRLQTQIFFSKDDYIVDGIEQVRFDISMDEADIYYILNRCCKVEFIDNV